MVRRRIETPIRGLMQEHPLLIASIAAHGATINAGRPIVSRDGDGRILRYTQAEAERRARRLAHGLEQAGIRPGDRIGTLAWNDHRHLELFFGAPGMGSILHTINPRLGEDQIAYIAAHAEDRLLFFSPDLLPLVEAIAPRLPSVEHYVMMAGEDRLPARSDLPLLSYETLLGDEDYEWPLMDEEAASILCYTSGTTGAPKGVLSSHRSVVLHALYAQSPVALDLKASETVLLVVPMFHAQGWGLPFIAPICGAGLVLPGPAPEPATLLRLIREEKATLALGVPTVWTGLLEALAAEGGDLSPLRRALIGGSSMPPAIRNSLRALGLEVVTGWGMTELSPIGSFTSTTPEMEALGPEGLDRVLGSRAGRLLYPLEASLRDSAGHEVPRDGASPGDLWVRGPCVASAYFRSGQDSPLDAEGWFPTGDVATMDAHGTIAITDRFKDLIKSGGEWISSTELEHAAMQVETVAQAAAIAVDHPKWQERPLLLLVAKAGRSIDRMAVERALADRLPRWQLPDDIVTVESLPLTATGKLDKKALRTRWRDHLVTTNREARA